MNNSYAEIIKQKYGYINIVINFPSIIIGLRSVNHKFDSYGGIKFTFSEEMNENDISLVFKELKSIINNENDLLFVIFHEHFFAYHKVIKNEIKIIT